MIDILVAAIASNLFGALWYSGYAFGNAWHNLMGFTKKEIEQQKTNIQYAYVGSFLVSLLKSLVIYMFLALLQPTLIQVLLLVVILWLGFPFANQFGQLLWEGRKTKLFFINAAYSLVNLLIIALAIFYM